MVSFHFQRLETVWPSKLLPVWMQRVSVGKYWPDCEAGEAGEGRREGDRTSRESPDRGLGGSDSLSDVDPDAVLDTLVGRREKGEEGEVDVAAREGDAEGVLEVGSGSAGRNLDLVLGPGGRRKGGGVDGGRGKSGVVRL